ncbi:uncharacterized protein METZ01_LOCUS207723 [marine metagenome]|uniref:Uncharacterized protein n=1 Tax=marine metagenome TaxID=408172 RepID=A0A382EWN0_9ZZZZ
MTFMSELDDLIRSGYGDKNKLRNIRETIKHDNFITTADKKYVSSLITKYLRNQPLEESDSFEEDYVGEVETTPQKLVSKGQPKTSLSVNTKLVIPIAIAAAVAIIAVIGFSAMNQGGVTDPVVSSTPNNPLLINIDQSTYQKADIISISGDTNSHSKSVELSIENSNGVKIWSENITPKNDGIFSTLIIAGGGGWENGGDYLLKVVQGDLKNEAKFKFVA